MNDVRVAPAVLALDPAARAKRRQERIDRITSFVKEQAQTIANIEARVEAADARVRNTEVRLERAARLLGFRVAEVDRLQTVLRQLLEASAVPADRIRDVMDALAVTPASG